MGAVHSIITCRTSDLVEKRFDVSSPERRLRHHTPSLWQNIFLRFSIGSGKLVDEQNT